MAHKLFDDAQIAAAYTLNGYFVTFSPWFEGDSMLVSFVKKGSSGKDKIEIYVSLRRFEKLVKSIEDGTFKKALEKDTETDTPGAWSYVTGANGSKVLSLGLGKVNPKTGKRSIIIHGYNAEEKKNADVRIDWDVLEELAENYKLVVGQAPADNCWHKMLYDAFWDAYAKKSKNYAKSSDDEEHKVPEDVQENVAEEPASPAEKTESVETVTLKSYTKEGDVVSFDGEIKGESAIVRIDSQELAGKDKSIWSKASKDMKKGPVNMLLNLRRVRNNEYTVLAVAK